MTLRFLAEAQVELDDAFRYYEAQRTGLGVTLATEIRDGLDRIEQYPKAWQLRGKRARCYSLARFPYGIIYVPISEDIVVVSIMHLHRKPDYWTGRLKKI